MDQQPPPAAQAPIPVAQVAFDPPIAHPPVHALHGGGALTPGVPMVPGYLQFSVTDDDMPSGSVRNYAFLQPDDSDGAQTERKGEFCYLCRASTIVGNEQYERINQMWNDNQLKHTPAHLAKLIATYYNERLRDAEVNDPEWTWDVVCRHFTSHVVSAPNIIARQARMFEYFSRQVSMLVLTADSDGRLNGVNTANMRAFVELSKFELSLLPHLGK